jgi:glycosyltransferase involved in cell wall biosynthesis
VQQFVSVIIPAYNEENGVYPVVSELRELLAKLSITAEIIVVDDGSTDETGARAASAGARVLRHRSNRGYGASLKTGILAAKYDVIAITDADGTYPAEHLPALLADLESNDMVVGARIGRKAKIPLVRKPAKWVLNRMADYVTGIRIPDLNSGLRTFRRDLALQYLPILCDQFSFTTTLTLSMLCDNYTVSYVPIQYRARTGKSKIVPWDVGNFAILILRMAMLFRPLKVFAPIAMLFLTYGIVKASLDLTRDQNVSASAVIGFISALVIILIGMLADSIAIRLGRLVPRLPASENSRYVERTSTERAELS